MIQSRSQFDEYKQVYRFTFDQPKIVFRSNPDYDGPMIKHGEDILENLKSNPCALLASIRFILFSLTADASSPARSTSPPSSGALPSLRRFRRSANSTGESPGPLSRAYGAQAR